MNAFHCICSKPAFYNQEFYMQDYQILTMILSALQWRKNCGNIKLVLDECALKYIKDNFLEYIWDDIELLKEEDIDYEMFWAGAKIFALKSQNTPIAMIDLDMIVWNNMEDELSDKKIAAIHSEPIMSNTYKDKYYFNMRRDYTFDDEFDWDVLPSNTAFLYIQDEEFKNYYCDEAINFMKNSAKSDDKLCYMVFAEQRLLSMCAKKKDINVDYLIEFPKAIGNQDNFTHIWGYKNVLAQNENENYKFCKRCVNRIIKDFPKESVLLVDKAFFYKYMD